MKLIFTFLLFSYYLVGFSQKEEHNPKQYLYQIEIIDFEEDKINNSINSIRQIKGVEESYFDFGLNSFVIKVNEQKGFQNEDDFKPIILSNGLQIKEFRREYIGKLNSNVSTIKLPKQPKRGEQSYPAKKETDLFSGKRKL